MTSWSFLPLIHRAATPAQNPCDAIIVEPNARGGWSLRFEGDAPDQAIGNYATAGDAERIARLNVSNVRVVHPEPATP